VSDCRPLGPAAIEGMDLVRREDAGRASLLAPLTLGVLNLRVERRTNPQFNLCSDDVERSAADDGGMTTNEYLLNAAFVLLVLRQSRERELDRRSVIVPLVLMFFVGSTYLHTLPSGGNDLVLIVLLAAVGLTLGLFGGFATHVRVGQGGVALARVGWIAAALLVFGIGARMAFAFAIGHGFEPAVRSFSIAHQIGAAAWPVALVSMALVEVGARIAVVQVRGRRLVAS
jgi:hypothetical protein